MPDMGGVVMGNGFFDEKPVGETILGNVSKGLAQRRTLLRGGNVLLAQGRVDGLKTDRDRIAKDWQNLGISQGLPDCPSDTGTDGS